MASLTQSLRHAILDLAVEDYYGLWEILGLVSSLHPSLTLIDAEQLARDALLAEIAADVLVLYSGIAFGGEEAPISAADSRVALDLADWGPKLPSERHLRFTATDAGCALYYAQKPDSDDDRATQATPPTG